MKMRIPRELKKYGNGNIPKYLMGKLNCGGEMYHWAAYCFNLMYEAAKRDGIEFRNIGDYRPYENQLRMFRQRYSPRPTKRRPIVTRIFEKKMWWLKQGVAPSATPGKSNHGWALAIDISVHDIRVFRWLQKNAKDYGFFLHTENPKSREYEAWHWQYCYGNKLPPIPKAEWEKFTQALAQPKP